MASRNTVVALCITYCHPSLLFMPDFPKEHFKDVEQHTHYLRTAAVRIFKVSELVQVKLCLYKQ